MRTHPCPCCGLGFAHTSELIGHVRAEHAARSIPDQPEHVTVHRRHVDRSAHPDDADQVLHLPW